MKQRVDIRMVMGMINVQIKKTRSATRRAALLDECRKMENQLRLIEAALVDAEDAQGT